MTLTRQLPGWGDYCCFHLGGVVCLVVDTDGENFITVVALSDPQRQEFFVPRALFVRTNQKGEAC